MDEEIPVEYTEEALKRIEESSPALYKQIAASGLNFNNEAMRKKIFSLLGPTASLMQLMGVPNNCDHTFHIDRCKKYQGIRVCNVCYIPVEDVYSLNEDKKEVKKEESKEEDKEVKKEEVKVVKDTLCVICDKKVDVMCPYAFSSKDSIVFYHKECEKEVVSKVSCECGGKAYIIFKCKDPMTKYPIIRRILCHECLSKRMNRLKANLQKKKVEFKVCYYCERESGVENSCNCCKIAYYCNRECQRSHWPAHKEFCKNIPQLSPASGKNKK